MVERIQTSCQQFDHVLCPLAYPFHFKCHTLKKMQPTKAKADTTALQPTHLGRRKDSFVNE